MRGHSLQQNLIAGMDDDVSFEERGEKHGQSSLVPLVLELAEELAASERLNGSIAVGVAAGFGMF